MLYEYKCPSCDNEFIKEQKITKASTTKCPKCGKQAKRQISRCSFVLKGSGWASSGYSSGKKD